MLSHNSILDLIEYPLRTRGEETACLVKSFGTYQSISWRKLHEDISRMASYLIECGIEEEDKVAIVANTSYFCVVADLSVSMCRAVSVPIYHSNLAEECNYILEHAECRWVFTGDGHLTQKIQSTAAYTRQIRGLIQLHGTLPDHKDPKCVNLETVLKTPIALNTLQSKAVQRKAQDLLSIIYTSGTTGTPKGVMITHANMLYEAQAITAINLLNKEDVQLLFLPLAHVYAKVSKIAWLASAHVLAFAENIQTLRNDLLLCRPTVMAGVPRVFEKFYASVLAEATRQKGIARTLFNRALELSEQYGQAELANTRLAWLKRLERATLSRLIFRTVGKKLKAALGGRIRLLISGGAPLSLKVAWFFRDAGIPLVEGFGLTETSAATLVNRPEHNCIGSVGRPLPGTEVSLASDGELLVQGPGVALGYWKDPENTAKVFQGKYFATGDIASIDAQGIVRIVDRKKDLIVTAGGKNIAPQKIETLLSSDKLIAHAVVHGDRRNYLTALITLDAEQLQAFAHEHQLNANTYQTLVQTPEVVQEITRIVGNLNHRLAQFETIKKFKILDHEFTQESGELTPSLKVKRKLVATRYAKELASLYDEHY
jgi:long-chain acyl-CoA synthetase